MMHQKKHTVLLLTMRPIQNVDKSSKTLQTPHSCASLPSLLVLSVEMAPYPDALHWIANPSRGCKVPLVSLPLFTMDGTPATLRSQKKRWMMVMIHYVLLF